MILYDVYIIKDSKGQIIYVGVTKQTKGYLKRFEEHKASAKFCQDNSLLHSRMRQEGIDTFTVKRILKDIPEDKISFYERLWVDKFKTYYKDGHGCNMTYGGFGNLGYIFTDDVRKKQSDASKLYWREFKSDEIKFSQWKENLSSKFKGRKFSDEHKHKLSEIAKGRVGYLNSFYGKHHKDDMKQALTKSNGIPVDMFDIETGEFIQSFPSALIAGRYMVKQGFAHNKTPNGLILDACRGIRKTAYGHIWKFNESVTTIPIGSSSDYEM